MPSTLPQFSNWSQDQPQHGIALAIQPTSNHSLQAHVDDHLQCPYGCIDTFGRREEYRRHMKKHDGPFYPCPHCGKMFYRQDKLRDHLRRGHKLN
jgi:uncharacterized C2H2 Zn-finger protein